MEPKVTGKQIFGAILFALVFVVISYFLMFLVALCGTVGPSSDRVTIYECRFLSIATPLSFWYNIIAAFSMFFLGGIESKRFNRIILIYVRISTALIASIVIAPIINLIHFIF